MRIERAGVPPIQSSKSDVQDSSALRWRIPVGRGRKTLRFALLQIAFATVAVGVLVLLLTPPEMHNGLLSASIAIALVLAAYQLVRAWWDSRRPANVWLDDIGLHWRDAAGREQTLPRSLARGYLVGYDEETTRAMPSLTLVLEGGFVSQPVELHPPGDESRVRQWLQRCWALPETSEAPDDGYFVIKLRSEIDVSQQRWLLQGSAKGLASLADAWSDAALLPLPPVGARPKQIELKFESDSVGLAVSEHTWLDHHFFAASPEVLRDLAGQLRANLARGPSPAEFEITLVADTGHHWKLTFGVERDETA